MRPHARPTGTALAGARRLRAAVPVSDRRYSGARRFVGASLFRFGDQLLPLMTSCSARVFASFCSVLAALLFAGLCSDFAYLLLFCHNW